MVDTDTFLTVLYVMADDFCQRQPRQRTAPGPKASLTESEVITLVILSQWARFRSERDFYRYATSRLRPAFPTLPRRSRLNRLTRRCYGTLAAFFHCPAGLFQERYCLYEALDSSGVATRDAKRRGAGWLAGHTDIGQSNRPGWYQGFHLLFSVNPQGASPVSALPRPAPRTGDWPGISSPSGILPTPGCPPWGAPAPGWYVADKGFEGREWHKRWRDCYGTRLISPPKGNSKTPWPKGLRRWLAGIRQIVETVFEKLYHAFGPDRERPHQPDGFQTRLAAKSALHNFCVWLNRQQGHPSLAFVDLLGR